MVTETHYRKKTHSKLLHYHKNTTWGRNFPAHFLFSKHFNHNPIEWHTESNNKHVLIAGFVLSAYKMSMRFPTQWNAFPAEIHQNQKVSGWKLISPIRCTNREMKYENLDGINSVRVARARLEIESIIPEFSFCVLWTLFRGNFPETVLISVKNYENTLKILYFLWNVQTLKEFIMKFRQTE